MNIEQMREQAVETIYLIPGEYNGEACMVWVDDPAPGEDCDESEAVEYVRKDVHEAIIKRQANSAIMGMNAAKEHGSHMEAAAKRLHAECNPEALESERAANALLTERIAQLEADCAAHKAAEETQIALRQKADEREQHAEDEAIEAINSVIHGQGHDTREARCRSLYAAIKAGRIPGVVLGGGHE
jgi:hypothetical protein